jgi:CubicO group peptidase (beta-lactamase class C family)
MQQNRKVDLMRSVPNDSSRRTFLKGAAVGVAACAAADIAAAVPASASHPPRLTRTHPEALGIDSAAVLAFLDAVEHKPGGMHSFLLLRHGKVAAEGWWAPYVASDPHMLFSLSKSFTSTAVGLAVSEGRLSIDDTVVSFFPESVPAQISANLAAMRVRHLLTMTTGHDKDATGATRTQPDGDWVRGFLGLPVEHAPGSKFVYNSAATYLLSAIVQKRTGETVLNYLQSRLFGPLGIEGAAWETCPRGIDTGGWGLSVKTEDIARFGQLLLQGGLWNGRQIVPKEWIEQATHRQVSNGDPALLSDWSQGYGFQFWRCRHEAYRGDGAFGQFCIVMPSQDAVLAVTSGTGDMQAILDAVWEHLLPGIGTTPLPAAPAAGILTQRLQNLALSFPEGQPNSAHVARVSGKTFRFAPNDLQLQTFTLESHEDRCRIALQSVSHLQQAECGYRRWIKGEGRLEGAPSTHLTARGAWTAPDTFTATLCFYATPFTQTVSCTFAGDQVTLTVRQNVAFGPTEHPPLVGHLV